MKIFRNARRLCAPALTALLLSTPSMASAGESTAKPTDLPATVIAHLPLPQATGSQMLLQKEKGKQYLYVQQAGKQGFMIVDVSKPEEPSLLKRTAESNQATSGNLEMVSPDVAIAEAPEKTPTTLTSSNHASETVRVLDMSDPSNPKTLETFSKVTSVLPDGSHGLIYLTNNEGLWVLRYNRPSRFEPAKKKPPCDSEAEIQAMPPDCQ
jgi:LVIVD repeat